MIKRFRCRLRQRTGFSLIEVLIGVFLVAVAVLGLAQLILVGMMNNSRGGDIANAVFLAQQEIDLLRTLTRDELIACRPDDRRAPRPQRRRVHGLPSDHRRHLPGSDLRRQGSRLPRGPGPRQRERSDRRPRGQQGPGPDGNRDQQVRT